MALVGGETTEASVEAEAGCRMKSARVAGAAHSTDSTARPQVSRRIMYHPSVSVAWGRRRTAVQGWARTWLVTVGMVPGRGAWDSARPPDRRPGIDKARTNPGTVIGGRREL